MCFYDRMNKFIIFFNLYKKYIFYNSLLWNKFKMFKLLQVNYNCLIIYIIYRWKRKNSPRLMYYCFICFISHIRYL